MEQGAPARKAPPHDAAPGAAPPHRVPLYARAADVLRRALDSGSIGDGTVLLEGPLAELLSSSRAPVRQALQVLEDEGRISRFEGRGFLAGPPGSAPLRLAIDAARLGLAHGTAPLRKLPGWQAIHEEVERDVVHLSVFERRRLSELELARHYRVGRAVARDVLLRLERLGLLEKDERLRWIVTPLDAPRINRLYELRWLLEPAALRWAAGKAALPALERMAHDLDHAITRYPRVRPAAMDRLEQSLHVDLLGHCPNADLLSSLERTRCVLTLSKHVLGATAPMPHADPFMAEHRRVVERLRRGEVDAACAALREHLEGSCLKVARRVAQVRETSVPPRLSYAT